MIYHNIHQVDRKKVDLGSVYTLPYSTLEGNKLATVWFDTDQCGWRAEPSDNSGMHLASIGYTPDDAVTQLEIYSYYSEKRMLDRGMPLDRHLTGFGQWDCYFPMGGPKPEVSPYATPRDKPTVQRVAPGRYVARFEIGALVYYGFGCNNDTAIADVNHAIDLLCAGEEVVNYTVKLPDGGEVPPRWAETFGIQSKPNIYLNLEVVH